MDSENKRQMLNLWDKVVESKRKDSPRSVRPIQKEEKVEEYTPPDRFPFYIENKMGIFIPTCRDCKHEFPTDAIFSIKYYNCPKCNKWYSHTQLEEQTEIKKLMEIRNKTGWNNRKMLTLVRKKMSFKEMIDWTDGGEW